MPAARARAELLTPPDAPEPGAASTMSPPSRCTDRRAGADLRASSRALLVRSTSIRAGAPGRPDGSPSRDRDLGPVPSSRTPRTVVRRASGSGGQRVSTSTSRGQGRRRDRRPRSRHAESARLSRPGPVTVGSAPPGTDEAAGAHGTGRGRRMKKAVYETELLRLQAELVKLQEWVRTEGARVVIVFEGRDAAGKGGTIKRVTEYLNPRVARIAALPGADRARAHPVVLPALRRAPAGGRRDRAVRPQLVQPRRRRAGDGLLHAGGAPAVPAPVPDLRADARRGRHPAAQVLVLGQRRRAGAPVPVAARRPDAAVEALADGPGVDRRAGRTTPGPRTRCSCTPTSPRRPGTSSRATTSAARGST